MQMAHGKWWLGTTPIKVGQPSTVSKTQIHLFGYLGTHSLLCT